MPQSESQRIVHAESHCETQASIPDFVPHGAATPVSAYSRAEPKHAKVEREFILHSMASVQFALRARSPNANTSLQSRVRDKVPIY